MAYQPYGGPGPRSYSPLTEEDLRRRQAGLEQLGLGDSWLAKANDGASKLKFGGTDKAALSGGADTAKLIGGGQSSL
jgi:hypothetical protein